MKKKQTPTEKDGNKKKAHILLGSYWIFKILSGSGVADTTLKVLKIEGNSLKKECTAKLRKKSGKTDETVSSSKKAAAGGLPGSVLRKLLRRVLKAQRAI